jgi:hypothetical protein
MKTLHAIFFAATIISIPAVAEYRCYTVDNPSSIIILAESKSGKTLDNKIEQANKASVKIDSQSDGSTQTSNLKISATSKSLNFSTMASDSLNAKGYRQYQVDCDGGNVLATQHEGRLALFSDRLNGDVRIADEGCATGYIAIMGAALLTETSCETLK